MKNRMIIYISLLVILLAVINVVELAAAGDTVAPLHLYLLYAEGVLLLAFLVLGIKNHVALHHQNGKLEKKFSELVVSNKTLLETVFYYFDSSFLVMNYVLQETNGNRHSLQEIEQRISDFYREHAVHSVMEQAANGNGADGSILEQAEEMMLHHRNMASMLSIASKKMPDDLLERLECKQKNESLNNLVARVINSYDFYSELIHEFFNAIIVDLAKSSRPLSEEILAIKEKATEFISKITVWEQELTNSTSDKNFSRLIGFYERQNSKFGGLFQSISDNYHNLEKRLADVSETVDRMFSRSSEIRGIAEKINILSINASIEASRATEAGKGFKVIASEINKLADMTHSIIDDVLRIMSDVHTEIESTKRDFSNEGDSISQTIKQQQGEFEYFYLILTSFENYFKGIFTSVRDLTGEIDVHINKFNPLFQLHEIAIQEMENLNRIISDFLHDQSGEMNRLTAGYELAERDNFIKELILKFEKSSISQLELDVLEKVVTHYRYDDSVKIAKGSTEIQLF
ncbi:MAG: hypothetical protein JW904_03045 [Spirochaetales bacterium]|nr:hypothetical protein [Spirochaetales bacterium]